MAVHVRIAQAEGGVAGQAATVEVRQRASREDTGVVRESEETARPESDWTETLLATPLGVRRPMASVTSLRDSSAQGLKLPRLSEVSTTNEACV